MRRFFALVVMSALLIVLPAAPALAGGAAVGHMNNNYRNCDTYVYPDGTVLERCRHNNTVMHYVYTPSDIWVENHRYTSSYDYTWTYPSGDQRVSQQDSTSHYHGIYQWPDGPMVSHSTYDREVLYSTPAGCTTTSYDRTYRSINGNVLVNETNHETGSC